MYPIPPDDKFIDPYAKVVPCHLPEQEVENLKHMLAGGTPCTHCGSYVGVELEPSRRMDTTEPIPYCRGCAEMHHAFWDDQWAEYRSSQGV